MISLLLAGIAVAVSFIATTSRWTGFKIGAAVSWIVLWIWLATNPPVTSGSPTGTANLMWEVQ